MSVGQQQAGRLPASDAFFLHVESEAAPHHVGGLVMLDTSRAARPPSREQAIAAISAKLGKLPRFGLRLAGSPGRPRWIPHPELDWSWHVPAFDLTRPDGRPGGMSALHALVADLAARPLPRDRPLWRFCVVTGVEEGVAAIVSLAHHAVADGIGMINLMLGLFDSPDLTAGMEDVPRPGPLRKLLGGAVGLAQLATDRRPKAALPVSETARRRFGTLRLDLDSVRELARKRGARVTDVVLCGTAGALHRVSDAPLPPKLLVNVPLMAADIRPGRDGNVTAGVMVEVPSGPMPEPERLAAITKASARLRTGTRVIASRFVMTTVAEMMPPAFHGWFARAVYGGKFFNGTVSNMPGAGWQVVALGEYPLITAYPIIPIAPGTPFVVGVLGWHGSFSMSVATDPACVDDAEEFAGEFRKVLDELA
ncbi:MAG TPA: wax ester/triacylglycerol synthase domain-containing protein [Amycolatopsis sp.]|uniref:wax ester/triacylglycerol synthase domain-containing protein n=1 Tax=Amycolatopsis sp. TaxID=37632 RepID=UPI002B4615F5|nr:wax ester/triacylglycerol synthase domain-containing protein [Amycolatopsis sp.]HKS49896.1 wax ester/triacylglycerol synthase domain-containing protein [Amycolatopsis sp.]